MPVSDSYYDSLIESLKDPHYAAIYLETHLEGDEYGFEYQLSGPAGIEKLKAIVTESKINLVESQFSPDGNMFKIVSSGAAARDISIIEKKVEEIPQDKWNEAYFEFSVK